MIKFYNTLTNKVEEFKPIKENNVSIYICGVTPYDVCHLGHARAYVTFDVIKRHFMRSGYTVNHVQNFTDVDDKIINRSLEKQISPIDLAKQFIDDYFMQMDKLNVIKANTYPQVTKMIPQIVEFIKKLEEKGYAYNVDGDVYFSVDKFKEYGKLSKRKFEEMKVGAQEDIERAKEEAIKDIHDEMVKVALSASEEILKREVDTKDNKRLAEDFINYERISPKLCIRFTFISDR